MSIPTTNTNSVFVTTGTTLLFLFIFISLTTLCVILIIDVANDDQKQPHGISNRYSTFKIFLYQEMASYLEILLIIAVIKVVLEFLMMLPTFLETNEIDRMGRYLMFISIGIIALLLVLFSVFFYTRKHIRSALEDKMITNDKASRLIRMTRIPVAHLVALVMLFREMSKIKVMKVSDPIPVAAEADE